MDRRSESDPHEVLDDLDNRLERLKRLYEQYFLGIQKIPPSQLHKDVARIIRELTQRQLRNTAQRYRLTTVTQRFGAYNTYWNRVLRQIENGTYLRDIARVKRRAYRSGDEIPDEVLNKMPRMMRERVLRDRDRIARRHGAGAAGEPGDAPQPGASARAGTSPPNVHQIDEDDPILGADLDADMDQLFSAIMAEDAPLGGGSGGDAPAARPAASGAPAPAPPSSPGPGDDLAAWREPGAAPSSRPARSSPAPAEGEWREPGRPVGGRGASRPSSVPPPIPRANGTGRRPAVRPAGAPGRGARGSQPLPPGMSERDARSLYAKYVRAREMVGESTDSVSFDKLMGTLRGQAPRIMAQHRAEGVEFNVVLRDNKVLVKAKPKK